MKETEIFAKIVAERDSTKRTEILEEICRGDTELKDRVQKLLKAHENPNSFFDDPVQIIRDRGVDETRAIKSSLAQPGMQIGPYKLLQQIGLDGIDIQHGRRS